MNQKGRGERGLGEVREVLELIMEVGGRKEWMGKLVLLGHRTYVMVRITAGGGVKGQWRGWEITSDEDIWGVGTAGNEGTRNWMNS